MKSVAFLWSLIAAAAAASSAVFFEIGTQLAWAHEVSELWLMASCLMIGISHALMYMVIRKLILRPVKSVSHKMNVFVLHPSRGIQFDTPSLALREVTELHSALMVGTGRMSEILASYKQLDSAKSDFLSIASHELRTPLTSIKGSLSLITQGAFGQMDPTQARLISIAESETDRLIRLVNDLLDLAKIDAGKLNMRPQWFSWNELCRQTIDGLAGLARGTHIRIDVTSAGAFEVFGDRDRLQQVLTNLLSNAIKYSPVGSIVLIDVHATPSGLEISVIDQGPGISIDDQVHIFERFKQGQTAMESPLQSVLPSTGLGLAIVKALIESHRGDVGVTSEEGSGSRFWFRLPSWRMANEARAA